MSSPISGDLSYRCVGINDYELTLQLYYEGGEPIEETAYLSVFMNGTIFLEGVDAPLIEIDTFENVVEIGCFFSSENRGLRKATYQKTVTLPSNPLSFSIIYQQCCRDDDIQNIEQSENVGLTYRLFITGAALDACNNSPVFETVLPDYFCSGQEFEYPFFGQDTEGDSVVYYFCTPLAGADTSALFPEPADLNSIVPIDFAAPYSLSFPLGENNLLNINPSTGHFNGFSNEPGSYVVGFCMEEYRNGELFSRHQNDVIFRIRNCMETQANFAVGAVGCDGLTLTFDNQSSNASQFEWLFELENSVETFSTQHPTFAFPSTGSYNVTLIAENPGVCKDTIRGLIPIQENILEALFEADYLDCSETAITLGFQDISINSQENTQNRLWTFSNGMTSTETNPILTLTESQNLEASLQITTTQGCEDMEEDSYFVDLTYLPLEDTIVVCRGETTSLFPNANSNYQYQWSPATGLNDSQSPNPVFTATESITYQVVVTNISADTCQIAKEIVVVVPPPIGLQTEENVATCQEQITLIASATNAVQFQWIGEDGTIITQDSLLTVHVDGTAYYTIQAWDAYGCKEEQQVTVSGGLVNAFVNEDVLICQGEALDIFVQGLNPNENFNINWTPDVNILEGANTTHPTLTDEPGIYTYYVHVESDLGCTFSDSIEVVIVDPAMQLSFEHEILCDGATVVFNNTSQNAFDYLWDFGDTQNPSAGSLEANPTYTYSEPGMYAVSLSIIYPVSCRQTFVQTLEIVEPELIPDFEASFLDCSTESIEVAFTDASFNAFGNGLEWNWTFSNGEQSNETNPTLIITESQDLVVNLLIRSANGCEAEIERVIPIELIDFELPDTSFVCIGNSMELNTGGNLDYGYQWSPANSLNDVTAAQPLATPDETTTYFVTVSLQSADLCEIQDSTTLFVPTPIEIEQDEEVISCGEEVTISPQVNIVNPSFQWWDETGNTLLETTSTISHQPETQTTFLLRVLDEYDCQAEQFVHIYNRSVDISTDNEVFTCEGEDIPLFIENNDPLDELSLMWQNHPALLDISNPAQPLISGTEAGQIMLFVSAENQFGCMAEDSVVVTVVGFQPMLPDTIFACANITTPINPDGQSEFDYIWTPNIGLDNSELVNPSATIDTSTTYFADISLTVNETTCMTALEVFVEVLNLDRDFDIDIQAQEDTIFLTQSTQLNINLETGFSYTWSPTNSLDNPNSSHPIASPAETTTYTVEVEQNGCTTTRTITINVIESICGEPLIFLPSAFTPNGDGKNDIFYVRGSFIEELELLIFNRWGQQVFRTTSKDVGWDGTFNGKALPPDVFLYMVRAVCANGEEYFKRGDLTLLR